MSKLIIHIGYPKAASTWLQRIVFSNEEYGFCTPWGNRSGEAIEQFVIRNAFRFSAESAREAFMSGLRNASERKLIPVLSEETLTGDQTSQRYWGKEVSERIHLVFPDARILICIREQKDMILSSFREFIKAGGTFNLPRFIGAVCRVPGIGPVCQLDYLEYDRLIEYYQDLFGKHKVLVLPIEYISRQKQSFIDRLVEFVGLNSIIAPTTERQNVGMGGASLILRRRLNSFVPRPDSFYRSYRLDLLRLFTKATNRLIPQRIHSIHESRIKQSIKDLVGTTFHSSNKRTSKLIGVDLAKLGYD